MIKPFKSKLLKLAIFSSLSVTAFNTQAIPYYYTFKVETSHFSGYEIKYNPGDYTNIIYPDDKSGEVIGPQSRHSFTVLIDNDKPAGTAPTTAITNPNAFYGELIYSSLPFSPVEDSPTAFNYAFYNENYSPFENNIDLDLHVGSSNNLLSAKGNYGDIVLSQEIETDTGLVKYVGQLGTYTKSTTNRHRVPELSAASAPLSIALLGGLLAFGCERRRRKAST